jgi:hypothetical protein
MRAGARLHEDADMPVLAAARPSRRPRALAAAALAAVAGAALVLAGVVLGYVAFASGFVDGFASPRPGAAQSILGVAAWAIALVAPSLLVILGAVRLVGGLDDLIGSRPRPRPAARVADRLPGDHVVVSRVRLPDGRLVPELVVGPFGVAVVEELPPKEATRQRGGRWEVRTAVAGWQPMESPVDRATRDAERVRRWLAHEDHDHVVRVYAAVVANESLARSPECAVVTSEQLPGWLASLPPQRSLNQDRRDRIVELLEASLA